MLTLQTTDLSRLAERSRLRRLIPRSGVDFSSNDYLGLSHSPRLRDAAVRALHDGVAIGSGGSRLLRGNDDEHRRLEEQAAAFFGCEAALFFGSGFAANTALFATLPQKGDLVVYDALVHASAHEGMRLGRAHTTVAPHNDVQAFDDAIARWRSEGGSGTPWIAVESLYSMDGDFAPLDDFMALADRHQAMLVIDEAHATGIFGATGRGKAEHLQGRENVITLHTCGKALGCEGALLCGPQIVRDFLINRGRGFIFSTAPSPLMAHIVGESLRMIDDMPDMRRDLAALIGFAEQTLAPCGAQPTGSSILPLIIGDDARTITIAEKVQAAGFDVRGIRPPTVPVGTSRLRISITLNVTQKHISDLAVVLVGALT